MSYKPDKCANCNYCLEWPYQYGFNCNHPGWVHHFQLVRPFEAPPVWCPES